MCLKDKKNNKVFVKEVKSLSKFDSVTEDVPYATSQ